MFSVVALKNWAISKSGLSISLVSTVNIPKISFFHSVDSFPSIISWMILGISFYYSSFCSDLHRLGFFQSHFVLVCPLHVLSLKHVRICFSKTLCEACFLHQKFFLAWTLVLIFLMNHSIQLWTLLFSSTQSHFWTPRPLRLHQVASFLFWLHISILRSHVRLLNKIL